MIPTIQKSRFSMIIRELLKDLKFSSPNIQVLLKDSIYISNNNKDDIDEAILDKEVSLGIAICGTGIGMSIALNKMKGIYCAKVSNVSEAILSKSHNDANVIALSEDIEGDNLKEIIVSFIDTPFSNINKYIVRNNKIKDMENNG